MNYYRYATRRDLLGLQRDPRPHREPQGSSAGNSTVKAIVCDCRCAKCRKGGLNHCGGDICTETVRHTG